MFVRLNEAGWGESSENCHYHIIDISKVVEVEPSLEVVGEDENGMEMSEELPECVVTLTNGKSLYVDMKAEDFVNRYLPIKDNHDSLSKNIREEMGKMISNLTEENIELYNKNRYMTSFIHTRGLDSEFAKYKLRQRNKEKEKGMYEESFPFN